MIQYQVDEFIATAKVTGSSVNLESYGPVPSGSHVDMEIVRLFSICLPSDYASQVNLSQRCYEVRSKNWNQSVGKRRSSRRAIAGTETEVFFNNQWEDLDYGGPPGLAARLKLGVTAWGGGSWSTTDTCEGSLQGSVRDYEFNPPYSQFFARECTSVWTSVYRSPGKGATSRHSHSHIEYFTLETLPDGQIFLVLRPPIYFSERVNRLD